MRVSVVLPIVAMLAATTASSGQAFAKPAPVVRDHRKRGGVTVTDSGAPRKASKSR